MKQNILNFTIETLMSIFNGANYSPGKLQIMEVYSFSSIRLTIALV